MITLNRKVRFSQADFTYTGSPNYTEYLFGSIGAKITADIRVEVAWSTEGVNMIFDGTADTIERADGGIGSWINDGFRIGDTVVFTGTVSNNVTTTITDLTDELMSVTAGALTTETVVANAFGETPIIAMDFYPNLIENSASFSLSNLTDRLTSPRYSADTITTDAANPTVMIVTTNSKGWVTPNDSATIYRSSFTNHIQTFVITHTFNITPLFLANQLSNLQNGIPPAAGVYQDRFCLKYVYTIDGKYTAYDPDIPHTTDGNVEFPRGQTGWFNEFINGRPTVWTKKSIFYTDAATSGALTGIDYCKTTTIQCNLTSQVAAGLRYVIHVMHLPTNEDEYVNTDTEYKQNFIFEKAVFTIGSGVVQGENTGDYHFLKDVGSSASVSGNEVSITFTVEFSDALQDILDTKDADNLNYLIFITPSGCVGQGVDACDTILTTNQTALIMDVNTYVCDKDDATLFQVIDEIQFFPYPLCNGIGYSDFTLFPRDTVIIKAQFHVKQGTLLLPITLETLALNITAVRQNNVEEFNLESFTINTSGFLPNGENIQEIYFEQNRDFIIPTGDCRNEISLSRVPTLDIAGYSAYELIYPFKVRWEEWRQLAGANNHFPTPTQNWMVYANQAGWAIKINLESAVKVITQQAPILGNQRALSHTTEFEHIVWGTIKDPCDIPYAVEINTFDTTGVNSYEEVIASDADTKVVATISGDFSGFSESQLYGILTLDAWGVGGVAYSQEIGTRINVDEDGAWYGASSTLKAALVKVDNSTLTLTAFLNYLYLPTDTNQFILAARIGEYREQTSSSGAACLNEIQVDAFTCGELEIIAVMDTNTLVVSGEVVTAELRNVRVENMILEFITATTWTIKAGGEIADRHITSGTTAGNIIKAPTHPYTDSNVGDTIQGDITGTIYSSLIEIDGIGDMQIGCTFIVS